MYHGRRKHNLDLMPNVASENFLVRGALASLATRHEVHPSQIQMWKKVLTAGTYGVFGSGQQQKARK